jgi:galactokinase
VEAPGILNLMGEHTDYNEGFVLQLAINKAVRIAASKRKDNSLRFFAADFNERKRTTIANIKFKREDRWANYPKGVIEQFMHFGYVLHGVDITISGEVPQAIGLGSSAALTVATAYALKTLFDLSISETQMVQAALLSETSFIGNETEITDTLTACVAKKDTILFLDLRSLKYEFIQFAFPEVKLLVTNSNVPQAPGQSELVDRKRICAECVEFLSKRRSGQALRDFSAADLKAAMGFIPESTRRMCMHVKRAWEIDGVYGSRITGTGFNGCTVTLLKESAIDKYTERLEEYERIFGFTAELFICEPSAGVKILFP